MKLVFFATVLIAYVSLSSQAAILKLEEEIKFPIRAAALIRGEIKDPLRGVNRTRINGIVRFIQETKSSNVIVTVDIKGLPEYTGKTIKHGFHIHEFGINVDSDNITAVCGSTGAHFNPENVTHGYSNANIRHVGDLGNLIIGENGTIFISMVDNLLSLYGKNSIIGRSVVLHENEDDGGLTDAPLSHVTGNSGSRIACGVIGYEKSEVKTVSRSLISVITTQGITFGGWPSIFGDSLSSSNDTYIAFEDDRSTNDTYVPFEDDSNSTFVDVDTDFDISRSLEDFAKTLPQTRQIFRLFFKILRNMISQAQDSDSKLSQTLSQFELPQVSDIRLSIIPRPDVVGSSDSQDKTTQINATTN